MCVQVQLGMRTKLALSLYNDEALPFSFALDKASYDASDALLAASGGKPLLDVQPVSGTVPPKSKVRTAARWICMDAWMHARLAWAGV
jgi:hypothetical protein